MYNYRVAMRSKTVIITSMNKKALGVALVASVAVIGSTALSVRHNQQYKNNQAQVQRVAVDKQVKESATIKADRITLVTTYNTLKTECDKGKAAYDALTPVQKTTTKLSAPICGSVLVK